MFNHLKKQIDSWTPRDRRIAQIVCRIIPAQCPFERKLQFLGFKKQIPPLCKLNPFYEQLVSLRFRAQCQFL
jgi:hypothetical protein